MLACLFDIENGKIIPSIHVHTIKFLKDIIDKYPKDYLKIYQYLFYICCPNPTINPYFNLPEEDKEQVILSDIEAEFSIEDPMIITAIERCHQLYETPTYRSAIAAKIMLDKINKYLRETNINGNSKDGNGAFILRAMKDLTDMRMTYKSAYKDLEEEQKIHVRGKIDKAYDQ